jgi:hypothetical protein
MNICVIGGVKINFESKIATNLGDMRFLIPALQTGISGFRVI